MKSQVTFFISAFCLFDLTVAPDISTRRPKLTTSPTLYASCHLAVYPPSGYVSVGDDRQVITVWASCYTRYFQGQQLVMTATSEASQLMAINPIAQQSGNNGSLLEDVSRSPSVVALLESHNAVAFQDTTASVRWCIYPQKLGRAAVQFTINRYESAALLAVAEVNSSTVEPLPSGSVVTSMSFVVKVIRPWRMKDRAFRASIAATVILNSMGLGCGIHLGAFSSMLMQPNKAMGYVTTADSHHCLAVTAIHLAIRGVLLPAISLAIGYLGILPDSTTGGLIIWSNVCGGGIGYILTAATAGNENLALFLEIASMLISTFCTPLWLGIASKFLNIFDDSSDALTSVLAMLFWSTALTVPFLLIGILARKVLPIVAHVYVAWILRPIMLLVFILFITLGIYSNLTVMTDMTSLDVLSLCVVIGAGVGLSATIGHYLRWPKSITKAVMAQQSTSNILLGIAIARFAMQSPERDSFTKHCFLGLFLSPIPFAIIKTAYVMKSYVSSLYSAQHEQQVSITNELSQSVYSAQGSTRLGPTRSSVLLATAAHFMTTSPTITVEQVEQDTADRQALSPTSSTESGAMPCVSDEVMKRPSLRSNQSHHRQKSPQARASSSMLMRRGAIYTA